jgi:hypothetical protein
MENTEAQDLVGTDFHALRAALTVPEKTFLGNKGADNLCSGFDYAVRFYSV